MRNRFVAFGVAACTLAAPALARAEAEQQRTVAAPQLRVQATRVGKQLARDPSDQAGLRSLLSDSHGNVMATLYFVFRESLQETNKDKKHWLAKLKMYNEMSRDLSEYLKEMREAIREIDCASKRQSGCRDGIQTAASALRAFETRLNSSASLPADVRRELRAMASRDRQLIALAREQFARSATLPASSTQPRQKTLPKKKR